MAKFYKQGTSIHQISKQLGCLLAVKDFVIGGKERPKSGDTLGRPGGMKHTYDAIRRLPHRGGRRQEDRDSQGNCPQVMGPQNYGFEWGLARRGVFPSN